MKKHEAKRNVWERDGGTEGGGLGTFSPNHSFPWISESPPLRTKLLEPVFILPLQEIFLKEKGRGAPNSRQNRMQI